jgi:hypothetical protein
MTSTPLSQEFGNGLPDWRDSVNTSRGLSDLIKRQE